MVWGTSERPLWTEWQFGYALMLEVVTAGSRLSLPSTLRPWKAAPPPPTSAPRSTEERRGGLSSGPHPENCLVFLLLLPKVRSPELLWAQLPCALSPQKRKFPSSSPGAKPSLVCVPVSVRFTWEGPCSNSGSCFPLPSLLLRYSFLILTVFAWFFFLKHTVQ